MVRSTPYYSESMILLQERSTRWRYLDSNYIGEIHRIYDMLGYTKEERKIHWLELRDFQIALSREYNKTPPKRRIPSRRKRKKNHENIFVPGSPGSPNILMKGNIEVDPLTHMLDTLKDGGKLTEKEISKFYKMISADPEMKELLRLIIEKRYDVYINTLKEEENILKN